jgi:hypothetical protein
MKLEDRILQYLPLLAPVPTAWMVGTATFNVMQFPLAVAVISALVIEGLGFVAVNTAIQMRDFNRRLNVTERAQKMQASVGQAYAATALYTLVALIMTVLLHVFPILVIYAPIPFILMAVAGAWLYSLRADFSAKVWEKAQGREQVRMERAAKKAHSTGSADGSAPSAVGVRPHKNRSADAVRQECAALSAQYACTEAQCGWSASVDALFASVRAGRNPRNSAASAKAGHMKNKHPKPMTVEAAGWPTGKAEGDQQR